MQQEIVMAEIVELYPKRKSDREQQFSSDPTDVSVVRFFEGTPFEEGERTFVLGRQFGKRKGHTLPGRAPVE